MKTGVVVAALVALVTGTDLAAVQDEFSMLAGFDIAVMRTATGVSLACMAGCSWKALEFPLTLSGKPTPVNEDGIADNKTANSEKDGHFLIRFGITDEGFALSCSRGCAWRTLGWAFPATGTSIRINEYGMAPNRKAVSGQDRPDFSGVWIQVDPPLSSESSHMVQIEHRDSVFKVGVQRSGPAGVAGLYFRDERTYMIGAPPESRKDSDGRVLTLSLDWQGEALVFVRTTLEGANTITEREVWSISTDGTRLMRSRRTTDWKGASTTQSTFQKR